LTRPAGSEAKRVEFRTAEREKTFRLVKSAQVLATALDDEVVLLDLRSGLYFSLNAVAAFAWNQFDGAKSFEDVLASLCRRYAVAPDTARLDLEKLIADLRTHGLVQDG
jgi:hypothetical protein